jgi:hypothetical protein
MYYYNARFERTAVNNLLDFSGKDLENEWAPILLRPMPVIDEEYQLANLNVPIPEP